MHENMCLLQHCYQPQWPDIRRITEKRNELIRNRGRGRGRGRGRRGGGRGRGNGGLIRNTCDHIQEEISSASKKQVCYYI